MEQVVGDVMEALVHGAAADVDDLDVHRRDDGTIVADYGDAEHYFVVTIRQAQRDR